MCAVDEGLALVAEDVEALPTYCEACSCETPMAQLLARCPGQLRVKVVAFADVEEIVTKFSIVHGIEQGDDALATHKKLARKATSLRLSNNQIVTVTDLAKVLSAFVEVDK